MVLGYYDSIFKNENALTFGYIPSCFPFREGQMELIADIIKKIKNRRYRNMLFFGPPGTGKTAITKFFFRELNSQRIIPIYFNCFYDHKKSKIYHEINMKLGNIFPQSGVSVEIMFDSIVSTIKTKNITPLVALDEVDQLCIYGDKDILYQFLRIYEKEEDVRIALIMIINDIKSFLPGLSSKIRGVLNTEEILFPPYDLSEIREILRERVKIAFRPGTVSNKILDIISEHVYEQGGDIRLGLDILRNAGYETEKRGKTEIGIECIKKFLSHSKIDYVIERLDDKEKELLKIIKNNEKITTREAYEEFISTGSLISYATFCKMIKKLENLKIIDTKMIERRGRYREIYLRINL